MQRSSVDLPEPEAPIRQTTSCSPTARSIPRSTSCLPNDLRSPDQERVRHARRPTAAGAVARISQSVKRASGIVIATKSTAAARYAV